MLHDDPTLSGPESLERLLRRVLPLLVLLTLGALAAPWLLPDPAPDPWLGAIDPTRAEPLALPEQLVMADAP